MTIVLNSTTGITTPPVSVAGNTSGAITFAAPDVAGTNTQTLVAATGTLAPLIAGTKVDSTSGTSIDFTSIPSWVKRITIMLTGVSTSSTSNLIVQAGTGATPTYTNSGYLGGCGYIAASTAAATAMSTGFMFMNLVDGTAANSGVLTLTLVTGTTWAFSGLFARQASTVVCSSAGSIPLAAALTAVRITTVNGTDTFDAGSINILYE